MQQMADIPFSLLAHFRGIQQRGSEREKERKTERERKRERGSTS
jgi:hypothetical protein